MQKAEIAKQILEKIEERNKDENDKVENKVVLVEQCNPCPRRLFQYSQTHHNNPNYIDFSDVGHHHDGYFQPYDPTMKPCNCSNSGCLKLYCECF